MYSHEIDSYLRSRNWELNPIEYMLSLIHI